MIEIKNLTKTYGEQRIFEKMNYTFPSKGLVCLLGASGCGKSTLVNLIAGFDSDYTGDISICGTSLHTMDESSLCSYRRDQIGFVFQNYNLLSGYTVLENILISCKQDKYDVENEKKAERLLDQLGMLDKRNQKVENLSGGQKQRTAIARALMNNPTIILADEPTGALDRKNATEIMKLLKKIAKNCLVLVITHDQKICDYADYVVTIKDGIIIGDEAIETVPNEFKHKEHMSANLSTFHHALKNVTIHKKRYLAISFAISLGVLAFMLSFSSTNILDSSIRDFKEKNTAFQNGYIKVEDTNDDVITLLESDERVENVYQQYMINDVTLSIDDKQETMAEKYPMPKAVEVMSYGVMPKVNEQKIALSPSLARKFERNIDQLINQELVLTYQNKDYTLTICGIYNASYDDFFVSSDIEQMLYQATNHEKPYAISYDVKRFEDVKDVEQMLTDQQVETKTAANEVDALQTTFDNLNRLFFAISILILLIGLFISTILLVKLQNRRYQEVGLLAALGFQKKQIRSMILYENILLSMSAALINSIFIGVVYLICIVFNISIVMNLPQIVISIVGTGILVVLIGKLATYKLIHTEPAVALRK